ncbi:MULTISPECIES: carbohydrate-binding module family 20 domain-containing protein [Butyricimonas]|uniref:carbohydrate-binding module family 20 domain-containing protein n=1 Tax=Butyricimonas TaxID=574697 RepID=UPI0007FB4560|nr:MULTISPECIES: carbohydrate-binding module family 20 domain-containing protein [Butyricimonas]
MKKQGYLFLLCVISLVFMSFVTRTKNVSNEESVKVVFSVKHELSEGEYFLITGEDDVLGKWNVPEGILLTKSPLMWCTIVDLPRGSKRKLRLVIVNDKKEALCIQNGDDLELQVPTDQDNLLYEMAWQEDKTIKLR